jgi:hypothetical protein
MLRAADTSVLVLCIGVYQCVRAAVLPLLETVKRFKVRMLLGDAQIAQLTYAKEFQSKWEISVPLGVAHIYQPCKLGPKFIPTDCPIHNKHMPCISAMLLGDTTHHHVNILNEVMVQVSPLLTDRQWPRRSLTCHLLKRLLNEVRC